MYPFRAFIAVLETAYVDGAVMQSAVANGKLDGQSVHALYSTPTSTAMWNSACSDESNSTSSSAAADCRAIVPMLSGKSVIDQLPRTHSLAPTR